MAAAPGGPRLAFVEFADKHERLELKSADPDGRRPQRLAGGEGGEEALPLTLPETLEPVSWSPDGSQVAYDGSVPDSRGEGKRHVGRIYVAAADGSGSRIVPGATEGFAPVFGPDGQTIAFARRRMEVHRSGPQGKPRRYRSISTWLASLGGGPPRQLTPWRNGLEVEPTSFSPDGSRLLVTRLKGSQGHAEVVALALAGGEATVLAREAGDGVYSPNGSEVAYLRLHEHRVVHRSRGGKAKTELETTTDLFEMGADGSGSRRLTNTPGTFEIWPSWDPSGQRLAVTELRGHGFLKFLGIGDAIVAMNADGSCRQTLLSADGRSALYGASWQPGAGREAGPILC